MSSLKEIQVLPRNKGQLTWNKKAITPIVCAKFLQCLLQETPCPPPIQWQGYAVAGIECDER